MQGMDRHARKGRGRAVRSRKVLEDLRDRVKAPQAAAFPAQPQVPGCTADRRGNGAGILALRRAEDLVAVVAMDFAPVGEPEEALGVLRDRLNAVIGKPLVSSDVRENKPLGESKGSCCEPDERHQSRYPLMMNEGRLQGRLIKALCQGLW